MRLSVVTPVRDQAAFLDASVGAALREPAVDECVVADGGSTDGTPARLAALGTAHPGRLRWWSAPDAGPAAAVNRAVSAARGEVVAWLNADDAHAPGAVARALAHLHAHPHLVMVYGHGEHVDAAGRSLGRYPTRPPQTPLSAFAEGCFICQPTVFVRRDAWLAIGGLDESLRTAFDFDLWLRLFRAWPGRIGFVDEVLAHSRLHAATITARERRTVALEGLRVLRRHLDVAPPAWLQTWFDEHLARHPWAGDDRPPRAAFEAAIDEAAADLGPDGCAALRRWLDGHRGVALSGPGLAVDVTPDGWSGRWLEVRWCAPSDLEEPRPDRLVLDCEHAHPHGRPLDLEIHRPEGAPVSLHRRTNGPFELVLPLAGARPGAAAVFRIACRDPFVPAVCEPGSGDRRELGFRVHAARAV